MTGTVQPKPASAAAPAKAESASAAAAPATKSVKESMFESLRAKSKDSSQAATSPTPESNKGSEAPTGEADDDFGAPETAQKTTETSEGSETPTAAEKGTETKGKTNPWKLVEQYKKQLADKDREYAEARKLISDPEARKAELSRLEQIEKRNKELEEHIRFVDYEKSSEYQEKYQKPYEEKWASTMAELKDMTLIDPATGEERAITPRDMLELTNLPLNKAMELAKELYGDSASIMMGFRKDLRGLFEQKSQALNKARAEGVNKFKQDQEMSEKKFKELQEFNANEWKKVNEALVSNEKRGHYFQPAEGDEEGNSRLERGYRFVDDAMSKSPMDPSLTPEQRSKVLENHAKVRSYAAGFGRLRAKYEAEKAAHEATRAKLAEFQGTEPNIGGTQPASDSPTGSSAKKSVFGALQKLAK